MLLCRQLKLIVVFEGLGRFLLLLDNLSHDLKDFLVRDIVPASTALGDVVILDRYLNQPKR